MKKIPNAANKMMPLNTITTSDVVVLVALVIFPDRRCSFFIDLLLLKSQTIAYTVGY